MSFFILPETGFWAKKKVVQVTIDKDPPMYDIYIYIGA